MYLVRLVYASTMSEGFGHEDIPNILESARSKNNENNVTGLLCFSRNLFLQCLEGSRTAVNETYHRIAKDQRHNKVIMLEYKEIVEREFDIWSMGYVPESSLTASEILKFSGKSIFDPYVMSGNSAHKLLYSLQSAIPTHS